MAERGDAPGGYAHAFKRERDGKKYLFDAAIHVIPEGEFTEGLLDYLGVKDRATLVECDSLYGVVFPEFRLKVPMGREEFVRIYRPRAVAGDTRTAIAWTTAAGAVGMVELLAEGSLPDSGFVCQEDVSLDAFFATSAGQMLAREPSAEVGDEISLLPLA